MTIAQTTLEKYEHLQAILRGLGKVAVAFSGGVDSTFLLKVAHDTLGENAVAITADVITAPRWDMNAASDFCKAEGIRQIKTNYDVLGIDGFSHNPANRCYLCKTKLLTEVRRAATQNGIANILDGANLDDVGDYRPGMKAVAEQEAVSPLKDSGLLKSEIRELSKMLGLPTWDRPASACLSSRFVYGEEITPPRLAMIESAEDFLRSQGFGQVRVRYHNGLARLEISADEFPKALEQHEHLAQTIKSFGFDYVTLDLFGYKTGSMNETIDN